MTRAILEEEALEIARNVAVQFELGTELAKKRTEANKVSLDELVTKRRELDEIDERVRGLLKARQVLIARNTTLKAKA